MDRRLRRTLNIVNLSTPLGLLVARLGGATVQQCPEGILVAAGYHLRMPPGPAFTLGDVVLVREMETLQRRPPLLRHEARHAVQYAWCAGPLLLPLYAVAAGWSWLRAGDPATRNVFERHAGLVDGGYRSGRRATRRWSVVPLPRARGAHESRVPSRLALHAAAPRARCAR